MRPDQDLSAEGRKLAFAILILGRLREGQRPPPRALEQAAFVEQWAITPHEDIFVLTGISWRLPLRHLPTGLLRTTSKRNRAFLARFSSTTTRFIVSPIS